jgi:hypothetical protein
MLECGGGIKSKRVWERKKLASEQQRWSSRRRARQGGCNAEDEFGDQ